MGCGPALAPSLGAGAARAQRLWLYPRTAVHLVGGETIAHAARLSPWSRGDSPARGPSLAASIPEPLDRLRAGFNFPAAGAPTRNSAVVVAG